MTHIGILTNMSHLTRTQSKSYARAIPLTECVWNFQNDALWDTH